MKKTLSLLSTISLSTIITTNIIACNKANTNNENNKHNKPIEPQFTPQQPPTNSNWKLINDIENEFKIKNNNKYYFTIWEYYNGKTWEIKQFKKGFDINLIRNNPFKGLYRWDGNDEPQTPTINKNTGKITNWNEKILTKNI